MSKTLASRVGAHVSRLKKRVTLVKEGKSTKLGYDKAVAQIPRAKELAATLKPPAKSAERLQQIAKYEEELKGLSEGPFAKKEEKEE